MVPASPSMKMVEVMIVSLRKGQRGSRGAEARGEERQRRRSRVAIMARLECAIVDAGVKAERHPRRGAERASAAMRRNCGATAVLSPPGASKIPGVQKSRRHQPPRGSGRPARRKCEAPCHAIVHRAARPLTNRLRIVYTQGKSNARACLHGVLSLTPGQGAYCTRASHRWLKIRTRSMTNSTTMDTSRTTLLPLY